MNTEHILAVINCTSSKTPIDKGETIEAKLMYNASPTFQTQQNFVEGVYDNWCILSAGHGLIPPTKQIEMYDACLHKTKSDNGRLITDEEKQIVKSQVSSVLSKALNKFDQIHFHVGNDYWKSFVDKKYQNHPKILRVKKQQNQPNTRKVYREGLKKYQQGESLDDVLNFLNTLIVLNPERKSEISSWWYHPINEPFWGRSHELAKKYGINDGNLFMHYHQDTIQSKHVMGWTNQLDNLKTLKQTDSGSWRVCGKNDIPFVDEKKLKEIENFKQNFIPPQPKLDKLDELPIQPSSNSNLPFISKSLLKSLIDKYYLGVNETVKWVIEDNQLTIDFTTPTKSIIGKVTCNDFQMEDCKLAIFDTKKLRNLVDICSGQLLLETESEGQLLNKLKIIDSNFNLDYALADALLIDKVGTVNTPNWDVEINLELEDIQNLLKAKSALKDIDNMLISTVENLDGDTVLEFSFGDEVGHNNRIAYTIAGNIQKENIKLPFNSNLLKMILQANKDIESASLQLSDMGLMKLTFKNETVSSEYFMVRESGSSF